MPKRQQISCLQYVRSNFSLSFFFGSEDHIIKFSYKRYQSFPRQNLLNPPPPLPADKNLNKTAGLSLAVAAVDEIATASKRDWHSKKIVGQTDLQNLSLHTLQAVSFQTPYFKESHTCNNARQGKTERESEKRRDARTQCHPVTTAQSRLDGSQGRLPHPGPGRAGTSLLLFLLHHHPFPAMLLLLLL